MDTDSEKQSQSRVYDFVIELYCRGGLLFSSEANSLPDCLTIGTDDDNVWRIPEEATHVVGHHVKIVFSRKSAKLVAIDAAFRINAIQAKSHILSVGDRIVMGDCELFVKASNESKRIGKFHRLEFQNTRRANEIVKLVGGITTIGSAKDNDVVLDSDTVSERHCQFRTGESGEVWIRDLKSTNGTFVNGERLSGQERVLMDSDSISVSYFDFKFLDRNVEHTRANIDKKGVVIAATAAIVLAGFGLFYMQAPSADELIAEADSLLRACDFAAAKTCVEKMPDARDFKRNQGTYSELMKKIAGYEKSYSAYSNFKQRIAESDWFNAENCIGQVSTTNITAWNWNPEKTSQTMSEIENAKKVLDLVVRAGEVLSSTNFDPHRLRLEHTRLSKLFSECRKNEPQNWGKPLYAEAKKRIDAIDKNCDIFDGMISLLNTLETPDVDFAKLVGRIENMKAESFGCTREFARQVSVTLKKLQSNNEQVRLNAAALTDMKFDRINRDIEFISQDECMFNSSILKKRNAIVAKQKSVEDAATHLCIILDRMAKAGVRNDGDYSDFSSEKKWKKILGMDCLFDKKQPTRKSPPIDEYDKTLGIRFFYNIILQTSESKTNVYENPKIDTVFVPECVKLQAAFRIAEETMFWLRMPQNAEYIKSEVGNLQNRCLRILECRNSTLQILQKLADNAPKQRQYFVATAARFYLATPASIPKKQTDEFSEKWRKFRAVQKNLTDSYNPLDSQSAKIIEDKILKEGIVGDPIVNRIWGKKR